MAVFSRFFGKIFPKNGQKSDPKPKVHKSAHLTGGRYCQLFNYSPILGHSDLEKKLTNSTIQLKFGASVLVYTKIKSHWAHNTISYIYSKATPAKNDAQKYQNFRCAALDTWRAWCEERDAKSTLQERDAESVVRRTRRKVHDLKN